MANNNEIFPQQSITQMEERADEKSSGHVRKPFVEPEVSVPVDVLEATTFFQTVTSGTTN